MRVLWVAVLPWVACQDDGRADATPECCRCMIDADAVSYSGSSLDEQVRQCVAAGGHFVCKSVERYGCSGACDC